MVNFTTNNGFTYVLVEAYLRNPNNKLTRGEDYVDIDYYLRLIEDFGAEEADLRFSIILFQDPEQRPVYALTRDAFSQLRGFLPPNSFINMDVQH